MDMHRARTETSIDLTEDSPAIAAGDAALVDDGHMTSPLHQWHAVLELKQERGAPTPPSTGGDWELLSPAKAGSACSTRSDEDETCVEEAAPIAEELLVDDGAFLLHEELPAPPGKAVDAKPTATDGLTQLGITWLVSWFSPTVACPSVADINDYVHQAAHQLRSFVYREWATVGLGASVVVLGTMLCSSYLHNRRMAAMLRSKDREVAKLVMKILSLQDTLQGRRLPIVRHTAWASFPSEIL